MYGFTETSLPTKLICQFSSMLIPVLCGRGIHIDDPLINVSREEKTKY